MKFKRGKRAQVALFIILAIVIVAALLLVFNVRIRNSIKEIFVPSKPTIKLQDCILGDLKNAVNEISMKGGSLNPENYISYKGDEIEYLCFTNQYYETCSNQQPLLKQHFERELLTIMKPKIDECMRKVKQDFIDKGYNVQEGKENVALSIELNQIKIEISGISAVKEDTGERYDNFIVSQPSKMYNLIMLANSIVAYETRYGDTEILSYMLYYPSVKVEKLRESDGSKIYILTDNEEKFRFATRSLAWPPGYSLDLIYTPQR